LLHPFLQRFARSHGQSASRRLLYRVLRDLGSRSYQWSGFFFYPPKGACLCLGVFIPVALQPSRLLPAADKPTLFQGRGVKLPKARSLSRLKPLFFGSNSY